MNDLELYKKFSEYGKMALDARQKCIGLLPEIYKRKIYKKNGFASIYECAAKLAGLSKEQVDIALRLERRFADKPLLHQALVKGEVSINKLTKIVSIATVENQQDLVESVKMLSVRAIETMVRDQKTLHVQSQNTIFSEELQLDEDVRHQLLKMQKEGLDINNLLKQFFTVQPAESAEESSRYIPASVKNILYQEFGDKCSVPGCNRSYKEIHHLIPYALIRAHNPRLMAQLCQQHHEIAHALHAKSWLYKASILHKSPSRQPPLPQFQQNLQPIIFPD